jgi:tRNA A37 methylthiotransferase MiaB
MNRGYSVKDFLKIVKEFRKNFNLSLWTDVIVGFPGETEKQFENTVKLIKNIKPDWTNISKFGLRPGTSSKFDQVHSETISERSEKLSEIVRRISLDKNKEWLNREGVVLISKKGKKQGQWLGRNYAYKLVLVESKENLLGKFVKVKIEKADHSYLKGSLF